MTTDGKRICRRVCRHKSGHNLVILVLLERDNFCLDFVFSLTIYAVVCSNVVVHISDHNAVNVQSFLVFFSSAAIEEFTSSITRH